jgi:hypothetical protein
VRLTPLDENTREPISQGTPILVDFGRLSSFLYLSQTGSLTKNTLSYTGSAGTGIVLSKVSGILSLYDLFESYAVFDDE